MRVWLNRDWTVDFLGWVVVHLLLTIYTMVMICIVVDEYFVPSLEIIADSKQNPAHTQKTINISYWHSCKIWIYLTLGSAEFAGRCSRSHYHGAGDIRTGIVYQRCRNVHHAGRHWHRNSGRISRFQYSRRAGLLRIVFRSRKLLSTSWISFVYHRISLDNALPAVLVLCSPRFLNRECPSLAILSD